MFSRYRSTGKERDSETGFANGNDYFGARYYSSSTGRFLSPDWSAKEEPVPYAKLDDPQSLNLYAYVRNNPSAHIDADGHQEPVPQAPPMARVPEEGKEGRPESEADPESDEALFARAREAMRWDEVARNEGAFEEFKKAHQDGYDDPNGVSHVGPPSFNEFKEMQAENRQRLFRYNDSLKRESYTRLGNKAAIAEANPRFGHGVSVTTNPDPTRSATSAYRDDVEKVFRVKSTPTRDDPNHHTVILPKPVTQEVADWWNNLFKP